MSSHWGEASGSGRQPDLNLLDDLLIDIDDKTLQCLTGGNPLPLPPVEDSNTEGGPSNAAKRRRSDQQLNQWLNSEFAQEGETAEEDDDDGSADAQAQRIKIGRKGRPMSNAAVAKAEREKQRRERLNEYVDELARLCDPTGKGNKNNRINVVCDAIRVIQQLRVENNQLKQLNKFLEERVGMLERAKAQAVYQQAMQANAMSMQQCSQMMARQQPVAPTAQSIDGAATSAALPIAVVQQQQQQQQQQQPQPEITPAADMATTSQPMMAIPMMQPMMYAPMAMTQPMFAMKQDHMITATTAPLPEQQLDVTMPLPVTAPAVGWLPAPDLNKDEKLRPPAA